MPFRRTGKKGFTLIELLIVIAIIGILASVVLVSLSGARTKARTAKTIADLRQINTSIQAYYSSVGSYPVSDGWQGYCSAYGGDLGTNWIPELTTQGFTSGSLPIDQRNNGSCFDAASQYIYYSNGTDYKLISHLVETVSGVPASMLDPLRSTYSIGFWSSGCASAC